MPRVVSLKFKELRKRGYNNIAEWLSDPEHLYIGRQMTISIYTQKRTKEASGTEVGIDKHTKQKMLYRPYHSNAPYDTILLSYPVGSYVDDYGKIVHICFIPQSKWHNPFKVKLNKTRNNICNEFGNYFHKNTILMNSLHELQKYKEIGCWCKPLKCHGDTILAAYHKWKFNQNKNIINNIQERNNSRNTLQTEHKHNNPVQNHSNYVQLQILPAYQHSLKFQLIEPVIHIKGFGHSINYNNDKMKILQSKCIQILYEILKNGGTLVWDGDNYNDTSFTYLIPEIVNKLSSLNGINHNWLLLGFVKNEQRHINRFNKSWFNIFKMNNIQFKLQPLSQINNFWDLGVAALNITQSKIILCFGGGYVVKQEYDTFINKYANQYHNNNNKLPIFYVFSVKRYISNKKKWEQPALKSIFYYDKNITNFNVKNEYIKYNNCAYFDINLNKWTQSCLNPIAFYQNRIRNKNNSAASSIKNNNANNQPIQDQNDDQYNDVWNMVPCDNNNQNKQKQNRWIAKTLNNNNNISLTMEMRTITSVASALCIIPPKHLCANIQKIRIKYDPAYSRWMPHLNIFFPFIHEKYFNDISKYILYNLIKKNNIKSFNISLNKFDVFDRVKPELKNVLNNNQKMETLFLKPICSNNGLLQIFNGLKDDWPKCAKKYKKFDPHLTVGKFKIKDMNNFKNSFQSSWKPISFKCNEIYLISRRGYEPFKIRHKIQLC